VDCRVLQGPRYVAPSPRPPQPPGISEEGNGNLEPLRCAPATGTYTPWWQGTPVFKGCVEWRGAPTGLAGFHVICTRPYAARAELVTSAVPGQVTVSIQAISTAGVWRVLTQQVVAAAQTVLSVTAPLNISWSILTSGAGNALGPIPRYPSLTERYP
jgi:hypothetical protein